jgi:uncharacterized membrane protein
MSKSQDPAPLVGSPPIVDQNVDAIMALQNSEQSAMTGHQRVIERMVSLLAHPTFLYVIVILIAFWVGVNTGVKLSGGAPWDKPPFGWLQTSVTVLAFVMTLIIVITQSRQGKVAERSAHLDLQVNLLVDQKAAKIIQLLEEMRADSPQLRDRKDEVAEELQVALDPSRVASAIAKKMLAQDLVEESEVSDATSEEPRSG